MPCPIVKVEFQAIVGFFKDVNLRQCGDYCGLWLILRLKGHLPFIYIIFLGGEIIDWKCGGKATVVRYDMFKI